MAVLPPTPLRRKPAPGVMLFCLFSFAWSSAQAVFPPHPGAPGVATQQGLPSTAPTSSPATPVLPTRPADIPEGAQIRWSGKQLAILANNSSLRQILRDVATQTGMKVTGGIVDERVFGSYGPAPAAQVLTALLDGTGTNLLILEGDSNTVRELLLSPRHGESSLPNLGAGSDSGNTDLPPQVPRHQDANSREAANARPFQNNAAEGQGSGFASEKSPNGIKTPQQLYEDLVRARQNSLLQQGQYPQGPQGYSPEAQNAENPQPPAAQQQIEQPQQEQFQQEQPEQQQPPQQIPDDSAPPDPTLQR